jgi:type VII secretion integral membrane protein EccD
VLARLGGAVLDSSRTAEQLGIRDGEQLYLTARDSAAPDVVFDDVVDAVATANLERGSRWRAGNTRRFGVWVAVAALVGGVAVVGLAGQPLGVAGVAGLGLAVVLLVAAAVLARAVGDSAAGAVLGALGLVYAVVGGTLVLGGEHRLSGLGASQVLVGGAVLVLFAVLAVLAVADWVHVFVGAVVCGVAVVVAAAVCVVSGVGASGGGAVVACLALGSTSVLPSVAFRLARLPVPAVPTGPEELRTDRESVDGARVLARSQAADRYLTGLLGATAVVGVGAEVALAFGGGGWPRVALLGVLALVLLTRARTFSTVSQRVPLMVAGVVGLGLLAAVLFRAGGELVRLGGVLPGLVLVAAVALGYGLAMAGKRVSPVLSRALDIVEVLLIVAVVPLAMWVCGLYGWIRAIRG